MIRINENTRISTVLKQSPEALEALVAITPKFEKLRNPLLRKLMAGRTSLKEAARIGHCEVKDIAAALKPLNFVFEEGKDTQADNEAEPVPSFVKEIDRQSIKKLDVRETLAAGNDPLKMIMAVIKDLPPEQVLQLINTFEPTPLIGLLKKKGYESYVDQVGDNEFHTYFKLKAAEKTPIEQEGPDLASLDEFRQKLASFGEKVTAVDVSGMEMPMPMVTILESMEHLEKGYVLSVQHKRIPIFLFNELKERQYAYLLHKAGDADVQLLIWKNDHR